MIVTFEGLGRVSLWSALAVYAALWAIAGLTVRAGLRRSLARIAASRQTELSEVFAATVPRPAGIAVFLVGLAAGLRFLPIREARMLELHKLVALALAVLVVVLLMRVAFRSIDAFGRSNPQLRSSSGIGRAATWVVGLALVAVLMSDAIGVSLAPALTALGVGSLAVALALQDTFSNFFSGLSIILDKPVRPGDFVRVEPSYEGFVESIGWRSTHLRTLSHNLLIIPNAVLSKAVITNYALPTVIVASTVRVDVTADSDVDKVETALSDEAARLLDVPGVAEAPKPSVALSPGFVDGAIAFTVAFYVQSFGDQANAQHAIRMRIAARLKREGISLRRNV